MSIYDFRFSTSRILLILVLLLFLIVTYNLWHKRIFHHDNQHRNMQFFHTLISVKISYIGVSV